MAAAEFELTEVDDDAQWDRLVDASPQGTVFSRSAFLRALSCPFRRLLVHAGSRPVALCCAPEDAAGERLLACEFTPYQGILFLPDPGKLPRQRVLDEFRASEFLIQALTGRYRAVTMPLSWHYADVRPFQWHNYHHPKQGQFKLTPRYTAILSLDSLDEASMLAAARPCRRQEYRKAGDYDVRQELDIERFLHLYELTFARQGITLPAETLGRVRAICASALAHGYGWLSGCSTARGLASMTLFLFDQQRAYYLLAANDPDLRNTGAATRLMFDNILHARSRGLAEVDFVGVNSPNRGDFKLSFNPELKLYFHAEYQAGHA